VTRPAALKLGEAEAEVELEEEEPEPESEPEAEVPDPEEDPEPEEPEPEEPELEAAPVAEAEAEAEELLALGVVEGRPPLGTAEEEPEAPAPEPEPELEPEPEPEVDSEPEPEPEPEASEPEVAVAAAEETKPDFSARVAVGVPEAKTAELEAALQLRSNKGVVLVSESVTPKLGLAPASSRMYHQVLVLPKRGQATSSQNCLALAVLATASFSVAPLTGQPVSVIQTSLSPAAALRLVTPFWKRPLASSIELGSVFS
jgi:hypothetical protein